MKPKWSQKVKKLPRGLKRGPDEIQEGSGSMVVTPVFRKLALLLAPLGEPALFRA